MSITITESLIASYIRFFCYAYTLTGLIDLIINRLWLSTIISIAIVMGAKIFRAVTKKAHLANLSGKSLSRVRGNTPTIPHWTLHDFRATFRTHAVRAEEDGGLGVPAHVADAVLGHKEASLGFARYTGDRDRYMLSEKRDALRKWGEFVKAAVEEEE